MNCLSPLDSRYTFDKTKEEALSTFHSLKQTFSSIFADLEIPVKALEADNGVMGGSKSCEFQCVCGIGEDKITHCSSCSYESLYTSSQSFPMLSEAFTSRMKKMEKEFGLENVVNCEKEKVKTAFNSVMDLFSLYSCNNQQYLVPKGR